MAQANISLNYYGAWTFCKPYQLSSEVKGKRVGKLSYALYTLGKKTMNMSRSTLEKRLDDIFSTYESRIRQTPMVTGRK